MPGDDKGWDEEAARAAQRRRALNPTSVGGSNRLLAGAIAIRNWLAMQCAIGSVLLTVLALLALALHLVTGAWPAVGRDEMALLYAARRAVNEDLPAIWWSEYLWLPLGSAILFAVPPALAYWLVYPRHADACRPTHLLARAALLASVAGALVLLETFKTAILIWFVVATCLVILLPAPRHVAMYRIRVTRALRGAVALTAALAALGVADTVARTFYLYAAMAARPWSIAVPAGMAVALAWLLHRLVSRRDHPLPLQAGAAMVLALMLVVSWSWIVLWVRWDGGEPVDWLVFGKAWTTSSLVWLASVSLLVSVIVVRFATGMSAQGRQLVTGPLAARLFGAAR